jgi:hypothetical protein
MNKKQKILKLMLKPKNIARQAASKNIKNKDLHINTIGV